MKNAMYLLCIFSLVLLLQSCSTDSELVLEEANATTTTTTRKATQQTDCEITGAIPSTNSQVTFTYTSNPSNPTVTWSWSGAGISLISGQGTHMATFQFGSNYDGGCITALGSGNLLCEEQVCFADGNAPDDCGYLTGFQDFNAQCSPYVTYVIPSGNLSIDAGWTITSYDWTFVANNGYTVTATGAQPTVNLSDTFCNCPWTATLVITATNLQGDTCQLMKTKYLQSGGSDLSQGC